MLWEKLGNLDRRWIYLFCIVIVSYALIAPLGLALDINEPTETVYEAIDALKPGDIFFVSFDFGASSMPELYPAAYSAIRMAFEKDVRVVTAAAWEQGGNIAQVLLDSLVPEFNKEYGVDYINLGYKPGGTIFYEKLTNSIMEASAGVDAKGQALGQFPIMQDFVTIKDAALIFGTAAGTPGMREMVSIIGVPHGVPITGGVVAVSVPDYMPLLQAGQIKGLIMGMKGAAELEMLTGRPGTAVAGMDAQSLSHVMVIAFIIIGNISYFVTKKNNA